MYDRSWFYRFSFSFSLSLFFIHYYLVGGNSEWIFDND